MLNTKLLTIVVLFLANTCFSQGCVDVRTNTYLTYVEKDQLSHELITSNKKIKLKVLSQGLFYGSTYNFNVKKNRGIYHLALIIDTSNQKGLIVKDNPLNQLLAQFDNREIKIRSENEIFLINENRPYFNKTTVDSIIGDNTVYSVNDKLYSVPKDFADASEIYKLIKKPKKAKVKVLTGKEAYERFGIIGLKGVIEIDDNGRNSP